MYVHSYQTVFCSGHRSKDLHFVSGYSRFGVNDRIIQGGVGSIQAGHTQNSESESESQMEASYQN